MQQQVNIKSSISSPSQQSQTKKDNLANNNNKNKKRSISRRKGHKKPITGVHDQRHNNDNAILQWALVWA